MTLTEEYSSVVLPNRARVFGRALVPPTIGHLLLLHRLKSPYVKPRDYKVSDTIFAVYVLSRPYDVAERGLNSRWIGLVLSLWTHQIGFVASAADLARAEATIEQWIATAYEGPALMESDNAGKKCQAPFLLVIKQRLMSSGLTREQALSYPIREALWDMAAKAEDQGNLEFVSDDTVEAVERLKGAA